MATTTRKRSSRTAPGAEAKKRAWRKSSDRGPHKATLPSGIEVTFVVPNPNELIRAEMLPDHLADIAIQAATYPDGAEGLIADQALLAMNDPKHAARLKQTLKEGLELRDWLVAHMLVDPKLTAEEVASGDYPQPDIDMLVEFAERRRNTDHLGVKLPIVTLDELAGFRGESDGEPGADAGGPDGPAADEPADGAGDA